MIRNFRMLCSVLLTLAFAITASAAAHGTPVAGDDGDASPQTHYMRVYAPAETMVPSPATPAGEYQFMTLNIAVMTFSTEDSAARAFEATHEDLARDTIGEESLEQEERDSLGDRAVFYSGVSLMDEDSLPISMLLILDGDAIYDIRIMGNDTTLAGNMLDDISVYMVEAGRNDDEVIYDFDGDSTGGGFDLMPGRDDAALTGGLEPLFDMDLSGIDLTEETSELQLPGTEGILSGYARMYSPDLDALIDDNGTPDPDMQIPDDVVLLLMTIGLTFDSEANAAAGFDSIGDSFARRMMSSEGVVTEAVEGLGDKATLYTGQSDFEIDPLPVAVLLVQEGELVHLIIVDGGIADESIAFAGEITRFIVDGEITSTEVVINPEGPTSTGGVFDLMPDANDTTVLRGLVPMADLDLMG